MSSFTITSSSVPVSSSPVSPPIVVPSLTIILPIPNLSKILSPDAPLNPTTTRTFKDTNDRCSVTFTAKDAKSLRVAVRSFMDDVRVVVRCQNEEWEQPQPQPLPME